MTKRKLIEHIINTMNSEHRKSWLNALNKTRSIKDGFGRPIDTPILETVAILRLMGFVTTMSCSGHLGRFTDGPYVVFMSPEAKKYEERCRLIGGTVKAVESPEYKALVGKAQELNVRERQKLHQYLEAFYKDRTCGYNQHLTLTTFGISYSRLQCQGADVAYILSARDQRELLKANQAEMRAFTEYLKSVYLAIEQTA